MTQTSASPSRSGPDGPEKPATLLLLNHDIRAAVSDVVSGLDLIDESGLAEDGRLQLERVRASAEALGRLIDEAIAEVTGEPVFTFGLVDDTRLALLDLLRGIDRRWRGHARAQGQALTTDIAADLPILIAVDGTALERILSNLIGNALKYCDKGQITLRVDLRPGGELRFVVEDEGPGFSDAALARLFEFRGRPADAVRPGTGMGLHICKDLADGMGGRLQVTNRPEGGAQVSLVLPRAAWHGLAAPVGAGGLPDLGGVAVLVAEDNPTNQVIFTQMLGHLNAKATVVADGRAALDALEAGGFDIALVDIDMPELTGIDVISRTRMLPGPRGQIPILAITAYVLRSYREKIYGAGADGILAKPLHSVRALGEAIASLMHREASRTAEAEPAPDAPLLGLADALRIDTLRLDQLLQIVGPESRAELLSRLTSDLERAGAALAAAVGAGDRAEIRGQTHILTSLSGALGAEGLYAIVQRINTAVHAGRMIEIAELVRMAELALVQLLAEIRQRREAGCGATT